MQIFVWQHAISVTLFPNLMKVKVAISVFFSNVGNESVSTQRCISDFYIICTSEIYNLFIYIYILQKNDSYSELNNT